MVNQASLPDTTGPSTLVDMAVPRLMTRTLDRRQERPKVVVTQRVVSSHGPDRKEPVVALQAARARGR